MLKEIEEVLKASRDKGLVRLSGLGRDILKHGLLNSQNQSSYKLFDICICNKF